MKGDRWLMSVCRGMKRYSSEGRQKKQIDDGGRLVDTASK